MFYSPRDKKELGTVERIKVATAPSWVSLKAQGIRISSLFLPSIISGSVGAPSHHQPPTLRLLGGLPPGAQEWLGFPRASLTGLEVSAHLRRAHLEPRTVT